VLLKVLHPLNTYQLTKFHNPTFTGASFAFTLKVLTPAILKWLKLQDRKVWLRGHLQRHHLFPESHTDVLINCKVIIGTQTDSVEGTVLLFKTRQRREMAA
jgi:hypothetical protein